MVDWCQKISILQGLLFPIFGPSTTNSASLSLDPQLCLHLAKTTMAEWCPGTFCWSTWNLSPRVADYFTTAKKRSCFDAIAFGFWYTSSGTWQLQQKMENWIRDAKTARCPRGILNTSDSSIVNAQQLRVFFRHSFTESIPALQRRQRDGKILWPKTKSSRALANMMQWQFVPPMLRFKMPRSSLLVFRLPTTWSLRLLFHRTNHASFQRRDCT